MRGSHDPGHPCLAAAPSVLSRYQEPRCSAGLGGHKLLAPLRNVAALEHCARGIDAMAREEAACWLGMVMHRRNPCGVLVALRRRLSAS